MSKRRQEKRRARAKEKQQERRRKQGQSPLTRMAGTAEEACECWTTYVDFDNRERAISVYRPLRGGGHVGAYFLIDYDCMGLKDAFVRTEVDVVEEREWLREHAAEEGVKLERMTLEAVRREVAGAMRWTRAHSFLLPGGVERCLRVIEGAGDVENGDVKTFGTEEGELYYFGYESDLARRLTEGTVDDFLDREDVTYTFVEDLREEGGEEEGDERGA